MKCLSPFVSAVPVRHVVCFALADKSPERIKALCDALATLQPVIREIEKYSFGPDLGLNADNADFVITGDFESAAAYQRYCEHPAYLKVVAEVIKPNLAPGAKVARAQFALDISSNAKQSLMKADPPLFDTQFGKSARSQ